MVSNKDKILSALWLYSQVGQFNIHQMRFIDYKDFDKLADYINASLLKDEDATTDLQADDKK